MIDNSFSSSKKVMDFYMSKLEQSDKPEAQYALQYANLKLMRYRLTCILDSLHSYDIKVG